MRIRTFWLSGIWLFLLVSSCWASRKNQLGPENVAVWLPDGFVPQERFSVRVDQRVELLSILLGYLLFFQQNPFLLV